ncbi:MAG TPA: hypothetical protein VJS88_05775, partial [Chthoniobacterales bacterium]|nr:hypothetical protein [Chthoniobacterales bacterium]
MSGENRIGPSARRKHFAAGAAWEVVVIDQAPLRREVGSECAAAMRRLDELRSAWSRFEREDKPSFVRWRAREFGPLLSQLREVEDQIRDQQLLVHEVEMEMRRGVYDPQTAFERVMFRRQNGGGATDPPESRAEASPGEEPR